MRIAIAMEEISIKRMWTTRIASDVSKALQEPPGERIALLRVGRKKRHRGMLLTVLLFPALIAVILYLSSRFNISVFGDNTWKVVGLFAIASALNATAVFVEIVRLGFIPALYWMEWSPAGLRGKFIGRRIHIAPESRICVLEYRPLFLLLKSPDGKWFPVPKPILRIIAKPIDDESS